MRFLTQLFGRPAAPNAESVAHLVPLSSERWWPPQTGTRARLLACSRVLWDGQLTMGDREARIGTALRRMAEDLVAARRRVADLERENRRLRARLETSTTEDSESVVGLPRAGAQPNLSVSRKRTPVTADKALARRLAGHP